MSYRDFQYPELLHTFGLTSEPAIGLFDHVSPIAASPELQHRLNAGASLAALINTEKARSEGMIAPVLIDFWWKYQGRIGLYSGNEFNADTAAGLCGFCDFLISRSPQQPYVTPPVVVIIEAKRENISEGLGQCLAGMVGAQRFSRNAGVPADPIYGCVTTGTAWKFLQLSGSNARLDLTEYSLAQVDHILGILAYMIGPIPQVTAA
jgi:hypothetical protein